MNNRTKIAVLSLITNTVWFILTFLWNRPRVSGLSGEALARAFGRYYLALCAGFMLLDVIVTVLVMAREKQKGGQGFDEATDERDRYIEGRAMRVFGAVFSLGFLASAALLAFGAGLRAFLTALAAVIALSAAALWLTYIVGHERGI